MLKFHLLRRPAESKDIEIQLENGTPAKLHFELLRRPSKEGAERFAKTFGEVLPLFSRVLGIEVGAGDLPTVWIGRTKSMGWDLGIYRPDKNVIQVPTYVVGRPYDQDTVRHEIGHFFTLKALFGKLPVKYPADSTREAEREKYANGDKNNVLIYNTELLRETGVGEGLGELFSIYPQTWGRQKTAQEVAFDLILHGGLTSGLSGRKYLKMVVHAANEAKTVDDFFNRIKVKEKSQEYGVGSAVLAVSILNNQNESIDKTVRDIVRDPLSVYEKVKGVDRQVLDGYKAYNAAMAGERLVGFLRKAGKAVLYSRPVQLFAGSFAAAAAAAAAVVFCPYTMMWLVNLDLGASLALAGAGVCSTFLRR